MMVRGRTVLSAALVALAAASPLVPACKFVGDGLGEGSSSAGTTGDASNTAASEDAAATGEPPTSGGPTDPGPTADPPVTSEPPPPNCGDGKLDPDEECDDGAGNGVGQACTPVCTHNVCGDGYTLAGVETCDDGNADANDGCIACAAAICGDGHVYTNVESCDGAGESAECDADCSAAACGDGTVNASAGELCDLGTANGMYGGACSATCDGPGPSCGDGEVHAPDEVCDPAIAPVNHVLCINECKAFGCEANWGNCDGDAANGCETDHKTDADHCGDCETDCIVLACKNGKCSA